MERFAKAQTTTGGDSPARKRSRRGSVASDASRAAAAEAFALYEEAIELDPTNWPAMNNAATLALNRLATPEKALELFRRAFALSGAPQVARNILITKQMLKSPLRKLQGRKS